jgi:hypothetical protein
MPRHVELESRGEIATVLAAAAGRMRHETRRYNALHDKMRLPGPSGSHGAYYKGRPRSYEPYEPSAYEDVEFYGQDSDDQHSE